MKSSWLKKKLLENVKLLLLNYSKKKFRKNHKDYKKKF